MQKANKPEGGNRDEKSKKSISSDGGGSARYGNEGVFVRVFRR